MGRLLAVKVGKRQRKMFLTLLIVQNVLAVSVGMVICAVAVYVRFTLEAQISFLGQYYNPNAVPGVLSLTGIALILTSSFGVVICFRLRQRGKREDEEEKDEEESETDEESKSNSSRNFFILSIMSLMVFVLLVATIITVFVQKTSMEKAFHKGMTDAMTHYKEKMEVKRDFDLLQIKYMCCGVTDYKDWFKVQWIPKKYTERSNADKKGNFNDDVPFSCCDMRLMMPCISEKVTEDKAHYRYDHTMNLTLYTTGCKSILSDYYGRIIFKRVGLFIMFIMFLYTWTVLISRYLQTSNISLLQKEDPTVGWLLTWGKDGEDAQDQAIVDEISEETTGDTSEDTIETSTNETSEDSEASTDEASGDSEITNETTTEEASEVSEMEDATGTENEDE